MSLLAATNGNWSAGITQPVQQATTQMWTKVAAFIPNLVGMLVILVLGYIVSKLLQWTAVAILKRVRFDKAGEKTGLKQTMESVGIQRTASEIVGVLVFWLFMLTFLLSAAESLGLNNVSQTIDSFVAYLPKVIGAAVIVVVGLVLANFAGTAVQAALERLGVDYAKAVSKLVYGALIVVIGSLAVGQLQIETALINRVIEIGLLAVGAALAITLGLGTRDIARHVVAGVYARDSFKTGALLSIGDDQGKLEAVTAVNTKLRTSDGHFIYIPNAQLVEAIVREGDDG